MNKSEIISMILSTETKAQQIKRAKKMLKDMTPFDKWKASKKRTDIDIKNRLRCEYELNMVIAGEYVFATIIVPKEAQKNVTTTL